MHYNEDQSPPRGPSRRGRDGRPPGKHAEECPPSAPGGDGDHGRVYQEKQPRQERAAHSSQERSSPPLFKGKLTQKKLGKLRNAMIAEKFGYSNECNPFNDANLSAPFVWKRKQKFLEAAGRAPKKLEPAVFLEQTERKISEIESVKKRREAREEEERLLEEQQAILARERELENYAEWEAREETFHREMASRRTDIRLKQRRERPADLMVKALRLLDGEEFEDLSLLHCYPHQLFSELGDDGLRMLLDDIRIHYDIALAAADPASAGIEDNWAQNLERMSCVTDGSVTGPSREALAGHLDFWKAMLLLGAEASAGGVSAAPPQTGARDIHTGIAVTVLNDLDFLMSSKTKEELDVLEAQVRKKRQDIRNDASSEADLTYWDTVMDKLPYYKAVAETRGVHDRAVDRASSLQVSRRRKAVTDRGVPRPPDTGETRADGTGRERRYDDHRVEDINRQRLSAEGEASGTEAPVTHGAEEALSSSESERRMPEPHLLPLSLFRDSRLPIMTEESFWATRTALKNSLIAKRQELFAKEMQERQKAQAALDAAKDDDYDGVPEDPANIAAYNQFVCTERQGMGVNEVVMTPASIVAVPSSGVKPTEHWELKYRPRKPRFFNRVKTGYEWNKYNQTHYDRDNPPPKAVQGYKFNLFYPDLIDKTKAPTWKLLPSDAPDTILIQFRGGAPYEDVVFKIINREWDLNPRTGFRNTFDRGIFQLHFNFKRYRYRR